MADLVKHAKRLDSRIKELNTELKKTQDKLSEVTRDKQGRLLKSALSPQGNATASIDRINQEIAFLKQKIEDVGFVKGKLVEELSLTAQKMREQRLSERAAKIASLKAQQQKNNARIKELQDEIRELKAVSFLGPVAGANGMVVRAPAEQNLATQILELESEIAEIQHLTEENILTELGIELAEEKEEAIPSFFWQCGQCGLEKSFATENEQLTFATRHFEGECEAQKIEQKRAKREEVLS